MKSMWVIVLVSLCAATLIVVPVQAQPDPPRKYALLVGLDEYESPQVPRLSFAKADVVGLAKVLEEQGYRNIVPLKDREAKREEIVTQLSRMASLIREEDSFLFYYAGHGVRSRIGRTPTYWLAYDARFDLLDVAAIRLNHLLDYVADIRARQKIIILDHCFAGDVIVKSGTAEGARDPGPSTSVLVPPATRGAVPVPGFEETAEAAGAGTLVIAAARGYAYELPSGHGVLTTALLKALDTRVADKNPRDARLSASELDVFLREQVRILSNETQEAQIKFVTVTNPGSWIIADKLKLDDTEARTAADEYLNLLALWQGRGLITTAELTGGSTMLETWVASFGSGRVLSPIEQQTMQGFREIADDKVTPDSVRAPTIKALIKVFLGRQ